MALGVDFGIRLNRSDDEAIANLGGWLTTVVARVCLDLLRSRESRREEAMGVHLPEPFVSRDPRLLHAHRESGLRILRIRRASVLPWRDEPHTVASAPLLFTDRANSSRWPA